MSGVRNGDRDTPDTPIADWKRADLTAVPLPYALVAIQTGLITLDRGQQAIRADLRRWIDTFDARMAACVNQAAEETGTRISERVLGEIGRLSSDVQELRQSDAMQDARVSQAEIKAQTALDTGQHAAVVNVNIARTKSPPADSDASEIVPLPIRAVWKRHTKIGAALAGLGAIVYAVIQAWAALRGSK